MFNKLSFGWAAILMLFVFGFTSCDDDDNGVAPPVIGTITDIAVEDGRFTTLVAALQRTGLADDLDVPSSRFTVLRQLMMLSLTPELTLTAYPTRH